MVTYNCKECGKECKWRHQGINKFCSRQCAGLGRTRLAMEEFWAGNKLDIFRDVARRFIAEKRGYMCEMCGISSWNGKELTLHVDHTDGDPGNNHPSNLRLLCPNCHSQTEFLGAANKGRGRGSRGLKH